MTLDEARALRAALDAGIAKAEAAGSTEVDLQGSLDASLGAAIGDLQSAIDAANTKPGG